MRKSKTPAAFLIQHLRDAEYFGNPDFCVNLDPSELTKLGVLLVSIKLIQELDF